MVSLKCIKLVKNELMKFNIKRVVTEFGTIELFENLSAEQLTSLRTGLLKAGMKLLDEKQSLLIEKIISLIKDLTNNDAATLNNHFDEFLSLQLDFDFEEINHIFSDVKGVSIKQYIIIQKIERAKELILYENMKPVQIAKQLHYKNLNGLTYQFKKITGLTPIFYKQINKMRNLNRTNSKQLQVKTNLN
jgi:AraC-like DNA-binding protein